ncbi:glycoside hydrolase family 127 protein [Ruminiclostridium herbifermentans]|uniref:cellulase n=1 Tax=Ruminiclostridium herbifermentans TaxID=2488810 RepID=A0A4U7JHH1_9FIRM|nr:beta-L-arabinofuranosidase domain-containing protein [Ruminiclostridium herbifermentans]QNU66140.1 glycoside hydrolase family 127 protein [Ruminiclostridium herbifermentans]
MFGIFKKSNSSLLFQILVLPLLLIFLSPSLVSAASVDKLQSFDMEQVKVTDAYLVNAFNKEISYLQSIDPNRLLAGYKQTAGLSTNYSKYGGWENTPLKGHTLGHYMSALAQAYKNTKDNPTVNADIKNRIDLIISELQACQNKRGDGYIYAESTAQFDVVEGKATGTLWAPWYTMHKIMAGLISIYELEGNPAALTVASNLGDWIYRRVNAWDSATQAKVLSVEYGGMNDCLFDLYKLTGKSTHLAAAKKFEEPSLLNAIASGNNILPGKHANTIIPKFIGAMNRYRTLGTSEASYLTAAQQFWNFVVRDHTYVTGGNSQWEAFRAAGKLDQYRDEVNNETCNSYNMLKLTRDLFKVTGDVKYADFYERSFINEILASQNPETGMTTYFKPMGTGYFKVFSKPFDNFWCCTGTGMENFTKLNDSIYFNSGTELYVNLYISSVLNWKEKGLVLTQTANVPLSDTVTFTIDSAPSSELKIKFRSPYWIAADKKVTVKVNGTTVNAPVTNGYIDISRVWNVGDKIEVTLPVEVQVSRCPDNLSVAAFTYGPVVLCAGLGSESMTTSSVGWNVTTATKTVSVKDTININSSTSASLDDWLANINKYLIQTPGKMEFKLKETDADNSLVFTPYYSKYTGRYGIYFTFKGSFTGPRNPFSRIEAESYNAQSGIQDVTCDEGTGAIGYIENGDYAVYKNMDFDSAVVGFIARTSSAENDGKIEIRLDSINGPLVGTCPVKKTGGWQIFTDSECSVSEISGKHDVYLKFTGGSGYLFNINWFKFIKEDIAPVLIGDLNGDNSVDATDFALMKMYLLGITDDFPVQNDLEAGDLNKDNVIDALDFAMFKQYLLGGTELN